MSTFTQNTSVSATAATPAPAPAPSSAPTSTMDRLFRILEKEYKIDTKSFSPETTLADTGLDSLSIADLLFEVEDVFDIKLDDMSPEQMPKKLSGLIALIDGQVAKQAA